MPINHTHRPSFSLLFAIAIDALIFHSLRTIKLHQTSHRAFFEITFRFSQSSSLEGLCSFLDENLQDSGPSASQNIRSSAGDWWYPFELPTASFPRDNVFVVWKWKLFLIHIFEMPINNKDKRQISTHWHLQY